MLDKKCCRCGKKTELEIMVSVGEDTRSIQAAFCIDCAPNLMTIRQKFFAGKLIDELEALTGTTAQIDAPVTTPTTTPRKKKRKPKNANEHT